MEIKIHCKYDDLVDPSSLIDNPKNPNEHDQIQIDRLAELYKYHGVRHPIIISNFSKTIVAGHGRKYAAIKAGIKKFPVVYQDFENEEAEYAFMVSDNAISEWSELSIAKVNMELPSLGPDFNLDMLGLKDFKLDFSEVEFPEMEPSEPGFQQRTFVLSNEQNDILNEALAKAKKTEDCSDELNQNPNGNVLTAITKRYVYG